jgi:hypothetical protein
LVGTVDTASAMRRVQARNVETCSAVFQPTAMPERDL